MQRLIFFPADPSRNLDPENIIKDLASIRFIDNKKDAKNNYLLGDNFLRYIIFMGCSPNINLIPQSNHEDHCYLQFISNGTRADCLGYSSNAKPKCPNCKKRIDNWKTHNWQAAGQSCTCDKCGIQTKYQDLNWKNEAGFARGGFFISHIYPHEAIPTEHFMQTLRKNSGYDWDYCYANNS